MVQRKQLMYFIFILYVWEFCLHCLHVWLWTTCVPCVWKTQKFPGAGVRDGCEPSCRRWGSKLGALQDQLALLTTELSLQPKNTDLRLKKKKKDIHLWVSVWVCAQTSGLLLGAGITDSCEPLNLGPGNWAWVRWESRLASVLFLQHPIREFFLKIHADKEMINGFSGRSCL